MMEEFLNALHELQEAMHKVNITWHSNHERSQKCLDAYPFDQPFDDIVADVDHWVSTVTHQLH